MRQSILFIVDVQEALVHDNPYQKDVFLNTIKEMKAEAIKNGIPVLYVRHDGGEGDELEKFTAGWEVYHEIAPGEGERILDKKFNSAFKETELHAWLQSQGLSVIILTGMQTEYCIDATCKSAFDLGYTVIIPEHATTTFDNDYFTGKQLSEYFEKKIWNSRFAEVLPVQGIIASLKRG